MAYWATRPASAAVEPTTPSGIIEDAAGLVADFIWTGDALGDKGGVTFASVNGATDGTPADPDETVVDRPAIRNMYDFPAGNSAWRAPAGAVNYTTGNLLVIAGVEADGAPSTQAVSNRDAAGGNKGFALELDATGKLLACADQDVGLFKSALTGSPAINDRTYRLIALLINRIAGTLSAITDDATAKEVTAGTTALSAGTIDAPLGSLSFGAGRILNPATSGTDPLFRGFLLSIFSGPQLDPITGRHVMDILQKIRIRMFTNALDGNI